MIGFFEHQYLSFKKNHIRNLLALAKADGKVHAAEQKMIFKIGKRYGLHESQIQTLIESDEQFEVIIPDNYDGKMDVLYDLMLILYADGVVDKNEVVFCEDVVVKFGMSKNVVKWLLTEVFWQGHPPSPQAWAELKIALQAMSK